MTTKAIIKKLDSIAITSEEDEFDALDEIDKVYEMLKENKDGYLACEALIRLIERHPGMDWGGPGTIVHLIEHYSSHYEPFLFASIKRRPVEYTLMLMNRVINSMRKSKKKLQLIEEYKMIAKHPQADKHTRNEAMEYYEYQLKHLNKPKQ